MAASVEGKRFALVVARFNSMITEQLLSGARAALREAGVSEQDAEVLYVPGAWELPQAAGRAVRSGRFAAIIALGCVIRGQTAHFDYVAGRANDGLGTVAQEADIPVIFGVLTTENAEQALERADTLGGNKGAEAVGAALEMIALYESI